MRRLEEFRILENNPTKQDPILVKLYVKLEIKDSCELYHRTSSSSPPVLSLLISPCSTLVHLGVLLCHTLDISEDEWPNFEFYPLSFKKHNPDLYVNGILCALKFRSELAKI